MQHLLPPLQVRGGMVLVLGTVASSRIYASPSPSPSSDAHVAVAVRAITNRVSALHKLVAELKH